MKERKRWEGKERRRKKKKERRKKKQDFGAYVETNLCSGRNAKCIDGVGVSVTVTIVHFSSPISRSPNKYVT